MNRFPGPPAGPSSPAPPRNPMPLPRPAPPPPPRPSRVMTAAALTFATVSISAGIAIMVAPLGRTSEAWAMPTAYTADLLIVPLFVVFTFVSLLLGGAQRHHPGRSAPSDAVRRDVTPVGPGCVGAERPVGSGGVR